MRPTIAILIAATLASAGWAAGPDVRAFRVTDVTPRSFRVAWLSSEAATATVRLFQAPDCVNEIFTATLTPFPTRGGDPELVEAAQEKGVMLVEVANLEPDTEYCVETVTVSSLTALSVNAPAAPLRVFTERRTTRARDTGGPAPTAFQNDLVKLAVTRSTPGAPTLGALVLLQVSGASAPLTTWVGDAIDDDGDPATSTALALFDLNNLYDAAGGESLDLIGDGSEEISAIVLGGPEGYVEAIGRVVPADNGLAEVVVPTTCLDDPLSVCNGRLGDADNDGAPTLADADTIQDHVVGLIGVLPCTPCADVTTDLVIDMKDALATGQAANGLRELP